MSTKEKELKEFTAAAISVTPQPLKESRNP